MRKIFCLSVVLALGLFFVCGFFALAESSYTLLIKSTLRVNEAGGGSQISKIIYPAAYWKAQGGGEVLTKEYLDNLAKIYRGGLEKWGFELAELAVKKDEANYTLIFEVNYKAYAFAGEHWQAPEYKDVWFLPLGVELSGGKSACEMVNSNFQSEENKIFVNFENPEFAINAKTFVEQVIILPRKIADIQFNDDENGCIAVYRLAVKEEDESGQGMMAEWFNFLDMSQGLIKIALFIIAVVLALEFIALRKLRKIGS